MGEGLRRAFQLVNLPIMLRKQLAEAMADGCSREDLREVLAHVHDALARGEITAEESRLQRHVRERKSRRGEA